MIPAVPLHNTCFYRPSNETKYLPNMRKGVDNAQLFEKIRPSKYHVSTYHTFYIVISYFPSFPHSLSPPSPSSVHLLPSPSSLSLLPLLSLPPPSPSFPLLGAKVVYCGVWCQSCYWTTRITSSGWRTVVEWQGLHFTQRVKKSFWRPHDRRGLTSSCRSSRWVRFSAGYCINREMTSAPTRLFPHTWSKNKTVYGQ